MLCLIVIPHLQEYRPGYASTICWLNSRTGLALFFTLPCAALLLEDAILFLVTLLSLFQQRKIKRLGFERDTG